MRVLLFLSALVFIIVSVNLASDPHSSCDNVSSTFNLVTFYLSFVSVILIFLVIFVFAKLVTHVSSFVFVAVG